jgi:hypothetical protein
MKNNASTQKIFCEREPSFKKVWNIKIKESFQNHNVKEEPY